MAPAGEWVFTRTHTPAPMAHGGCGGLRGSTPVTLAGRACKCMRQCGTRPALPARTIPCTCTHTRMRACACTHAHAHTRKPSRARRTHACAGSTIALASFSVEQAGSPVDLAAAKLGPDQPPVLARGRAGGAAQRGWAHPLSCACSNALGSLGSRNAHAVDARGCFLLTLPPCQPVACR